MRGKTGRGLLRGPAKSPAYRGGNRLSLEWGIARQKGSWMRQNAAGAVSNQDREHQKTKFREATTGDGTFLR
jgi:hypothetical protein